MRSRRSNVENPFADQDGSSERVSNDFYRGQVKHRQKWSRIGVFGALIFVLVYLTFFRSLRIDKNEESSSSRSVVVETEQQKVRFILSADKKHAGSVSKQPPQSSIFTKHDHYKNDEKEDKTNAFVIDEFKKNKTDGQIKNETKEELSQHLFISEFQPVSQKELERLSPPTTVYEANSVQLDPEVMILIGGYLQGYSRVFRSIQFLKITSQEWNQEKTVSLPDALAETQQGITYDQDTRLLYIVSGQKGAGCRPAVTDAARIHVDTGQVDILPPLPKARYSPGAAVVNDLFNPAVQHLHVFGGAAENRNQTATDHWRLVMDDSKDPTSWSWEELEPLPDAGTHGRAVAINGAIYYTAFCTLGQGVFPIDDMEACQAYAKQRVGQLLHHTSDAGFLLKYDTFTKNATWERLPDMPFPVCHTGPLLLDGKLYLIGGGIATTQTRIGSSPTSMRRVQSFDMEKMSWSSFEFRTDKNWHLYYFLATWYDSSRNKVFGMRPSQSLIVGTVGNVSSDQSADQRLVETHRQKFLYQTRKLAVDTVQQCISSKNQLNMKSVFDKDGYDDVRGTWNKRNRHLQYPDLIVFPLTVQDVSAVVQCAKRTGYHVCGRNGKHSFEGDTCTNGIVVDVKNLNSVEVTDQEKGVVTVGAGLHLGRVTVELERFGLTLPMGHCATVGVTGLVLVGGQGLLSRQYGITSDFVDWIQLVDARGRVINATANNDYADLLWHARGGGSGVQHFPGIITALQFTGLPELDQGNLTWTHLEIRHKPTVDNAEKLLLAWQDFYLDPENVNDPLFNRLTVEPWLFLQPGPKDGFDEALYLSVYFYGGDKLHAKFAAILLPKIKKLLDGGKVSKMNRYDDLHFHRKLAGVQSDLELASGRHGWDTYESRYVLNHWKGYSAVASGRVPGSAFRSIAKAIFESQPLSRRYAEFKPLGGAIRKLKQTDTAFWHRNADWWVLTSHSYRSSDKRNYVDRILQESRLRHSDFIKLMGDAFSGMYAGYIDHSNSTSRDLRFNYGGNARRIMEIKRHRDPHNLFRNYLPNNAGNAPLSPSSEMT